MTSRTFYTADLHLGHRLVAGIRGFRMPDPRIGSLVPGSVQASAMMVPWTDGHDAALIDIWNKIVKPGDTVWVLGDITLRGYADIVHLVRLLNGHKHLVLGNHDEAHPMHRGAHKKLELYLIGPGNFETVQTQASVRLEGQQVMLSHFPYTGDRGEDRAKAWRMRDEGHPIIHGHTHLPGQLSWSEKGTIQIHVGMDAWNLAPVSEEIIMRYLRTAPQVRQAEFSASTTRIIERSRPVLDALKEYGD